MLKMLASKWLTLCPAKCGLTKKGGKAMRIAVTLMKRDEEVSDKFTEEELARDRIAWKTAITLCESKTDHADLHSECGRGLKGERTAGLNDLKSQI